MTAGPDAYNEPLTRRGHAWRIVICLLISGLAWGDVVAGQVHHHPALFALDLVGGVTAYALVVRRRRSPFRIALALAALGAVSAAAAGPGVLAYVSLATRRRIPEIALVGAVNIVAGQLYAQYEPTTSNNPLWLDLTFATVITLAFALLGMYFGSRRELLWTLRERARQAEAEQGLRVAQAQAAERERIAREMHDVLAHRISLVTMHAGALAYRTDLPPEQVRETATLIQTKAHEALTDLRQVLGVLRGDATGDRPQPTLADLDGLLAEARESGTLVDLEDGLDGVAPAEQTGRTLYRIIQEGLTNARKHAPGTRVRVSLTGDADAGVTVTISNPKPVGALGRAPAPRSGLGLVGLRERAALAGGTLDVLDSPDGFGLRGWLPWTPPGTTGQAL